MAAGTGLISTITRHRVAPNVLMVVFILAGVYAFGHLKTRFFPPFAVNVVGVYVTMDGQSSSDAEENMLVPLENAVRAVEGYESFYGYALQNYAWVAVEFPEGTNMDKAFKDIKSEVDRSSLPSQADEPRVVRWARKEDIAKITLAGDQRSELRSVARRLESDLNALAIGKVEVKGLPAEQINVLVSQQQLLANGISLEQIGAAIKATNRDASMGSLSGGASTRSLRVTAESSEFDDLYRIAVAVAPDGSVTYLRDIATIERVKQSDQVEISYNGRPAAEFEITGSEDVDILAAAGVLYGWLDQARASLPQGFELAAHDEEWRAIKSRRDLLVKNGLSGLALVLLMLFLFLSGSVAFWVAAGIPVAMLATVYVFNLAGGTLNMISMFALIMAVGIIVDDAIVVGENAQYRIGRGEPPLRAVIGAARTMFVPVFASSFTTVAAFLPLFLLTGPIGSIIFDIPLIIICILIAALLECFLILPGHLYYSFASRARSRTSAIRDSLNRGFDVFRERVFRPLATAAVRHSLATVACGAMLMVLAAGMMNYGFVDFRFFPGAERSKITASIDFVSGTPRAQMEQFTAELLAALPLAEAGFGAQPQELVKHASARFGAGSGRDGRRSDQSAHIDIELVQPDERSFTAAEFAKAWRKEVRQPTAVERLTMRAQRGGPPGQEIEVRLSGADIAELKIASLQLQDALEGIPGIREVSDDTPYGKEEILFELTPLGRSLNLDLSSISRQLRHGFDGYHAQTLTEGIDEVELRVQLDTGESELLSSFNLQLPAGGYIPLADVVSWRTHQGFDSILHLRGEAAINVTADLEDGADINVDNVVAGLEAGILSQLSQDAGIAASFEGKQADQQQTFSEMITGLLLAVALTYIILTWVFNSWTMPVVVMATMPMGVIGTIAGHWIMGVQMSILSMFGMFTLMGIIVNDSIVLVRCFLELRSPTASREEYEGMIIEAACLRLRAVLLTSLTTIGGLLPLLFESSLQAQFLIPMAVSICFGLAFATVLILLFTPACIALHGMAYRFAMRRRNGVRRIAAA